MPIFTVHGLPGIGSSLTATKKNFLQNGGNTPGLEWLDGGKIVDGALSGDWSNPSQPYVLLPGLILGKVTATGKYAPSVLGVTTASLGSAATTLNVSAAQATEIQRRIGSSGTFKLTGPPA